MTRQNARSRLPLALSALVSALALAATARAQPTPESPPRLPTDVPPAEAAPGAENRPVDPAPEPKAPPAPEKPAAADGKRLAAGSEGWLQLGATLQGWYVLERADETTNTFRIRRAEISLKGEILPKRFGFNLMIDPAKVLEFRNKSSNVANVTPTDPGTKPSVTTLQPASAVSVFQDFFVTYLSKWADVSIGQFKIPVSYEGFNSSSKLLFPERASVSREYGDRRDLGLRAGKAFSRFAWWAGVYNGQGLNALDADNVKDGTLRLEAYPVKGLMLGGVAYASLWDRGEAGARDRWEADARLERGPFLLQAEYIRARDVGTSGTVHGQGFYAAAAWTFLEQLQPALRAGYLDQDLDRDLAPTADNGRDELWHFDAGLNWYLRKQEAKLQLVYSRFEFQDKTANNQVILATQVAF